MGGGSQTAYYVRLSIKKWCGHWYGSTITFTKLEDSSLAELDFYFPCYSLLVGFEWPLDFYSHNSWSICKANTNSSELLSIVQLGPVYTMNREVGPWKMAFAHGPIILKNYQFTKYLGLSLGANQVWTKINDHTPKNDCADFFYHIPKKGSFGKK